MTDYLEHGNTQRDSVFNASPYDPHSSFYDGKPAEVAERARTLKDKIMGHRISRAINKTIRKAIVGSLGFTASTLVVLVLLESLGVPVSAYINNFYQNAKDSLEQQRLEEFTKQRQQKQFEATQKEAEQKRLEEKKREGQKKSVNNGKNKKNKEHSFYEPKEELHKTEFKFRNFASRMPIAINQKKYFAGSTSYAKQKIQSG